MPANPRVSVIIPARNAAAHIGDSLRALHQGAIVPYETIVVDDGSEDQTSAIASQYPVLLLKTGTRSGPAVARNLAAKVATGEVLFFLDSDVCVLPDTLSKIVASFAHDPQLDAIIGSYDSNPASKDFISQYRNLMHAYVHQTGAEQASTFWSGCGAIRRELFLQHSGFHEGYTRPAVEDIELGYRLHHAGCRIVLDRSIQVTHLKRWTFWALLKTDILDRGIPWTELILRDRFMPNDLNLQLSQRVSVALVFLLVALTGMIAVVNGAYLFIPLLAIVLLMLAKWWGEFGSHTKSASALLLVAILLLALIAKAYGMIGVIPPLCVTPVLLFLRHRYSKRGKIKKLYRYIGISFICLSVCVDALYLPAHRLLFACLVIIVLLGILNSQFYIFLAGRRGFPFMLAAIPFHLLYHFYNGVSFAAGLGRHTFGSLEGVARRSGDRANIPPWPSRPTMFASLTNSTFGNCALRESLVLAVYLGMLLVALSTYRQSEDEGQEWLIARSFGLLHMVFHVLRFVGHPPLLYLLLWFPSHLHVPLLDVSWLSIVPATIAVYVLLRYSPFPFYLRAILPFGFFLGYQYAVVARSYVLFPVLCFAVAHLYRRWPARPLLLASMLALLANVSIHGTLVATGFAVAILWKFLQQTQHKTITPRQLRAARAGAILFAASVVLVAACVWPAKYLDRSLFTVGKRVVHRLLHPTFDSRLDLPTQLPQLQAMPGRPHLEAASFVSVAAAPPASSKHIAAVLQRAKLVFLYPVAPSAILAVAFEMLVLLYLIRRRKLVLALPVVLLAYFLMVVYVQVWHVGLVWVTLIAVLWAAWDPSVAPGSRNLQTAVAATLALLGVLQIRGAIGAIRYQQHHETYPARSTAAYLKTLPPGVRIDGNELAFDVMPYFPRFIFTDQAARRFSSQGGSAPAPLSIPDLVQEQPDVILLRQTSVAPSGLAQLEAGGYQQRHAFCGAPYFPDKEIVPICLLVFEHNASTPAGDRN